MGAHHNPSRCIECGKPGAIWQSDPDQWWIRLAIWLHGYRWQWGPRPKGRNWRGPLCAKCAGFPDPSASPYVGVYPAALSESAAEGSGE